MSAPNRLDVVRLLEDRLRPDLTSVAESEHFTARVAATLHYGSPGLGIIGDSNWGRRRNPSGVLSNDVIQYRESGENFDIIVGAGGGNPQIAWNTSTPGPWVQPLAWDVVEPDPTDPGPGPGPGPNPGPDPSIANVLREIRDIQIETRNSQQTTEQYTFSILDLLRRTAQRFGIPV